MRPRRVSPGRLRRRLTVAFALVGGLAAVTLAAGSYAVVRETRLDDSVERSLAQTRFNLLLAREVLRAPAGGDDTDVLLAALERRGEFDTVLRRGGRTSSSSLSLGAPQLPADVRRLVAGGQLAYKRVRVGQMRYVVVGGRAAGTGVELYFFFSEDALWADLAELRTILLGGTALVLLLSAAVGTLVARRTLAPVAQASEAARSLAEGLLETRLPAEREDEFGAWARAFNEMAEALDARIAALAAAQERERRFTSDVAHELRTPVTALVAAASVLATHLDAMPAEGRRPAELLVRDVARLRRLVDDLMEISRLDAARETVLAEPVSLPLLVEASVRARGWEDRVRITGDDVTLTGDRRRLERIVANLIDNALEHGGGQAVVRLGEDDGVARVTVEDDGPGIDAGDLPHVFDRFYKADPARGRAGSGLGLAIAREHARLLGGDIDVVTAPGNGTAFTLRVPTVAEPLHAGDGSVSALRDDPSASDTEAQR